VGVLDDVEAKRLALQRPVGQPRDERVRQDRGVDVVDARPQAAGEQLVVRRLSSLRTAKADMLGEPVWRLPEALFERVAVTDLLGPYARRRSSEGAESVAGEPGWNTASTSRN